MIIASTKVTGTGDRFYWSNEMDANTFEDKQLKACFGHFITPI
jgi:hypothetical protein